MASFRLTFVSMKLTIICILELNLKVSKVITQEYLTLILRIELKKTAECCKKRYKPKKIIIINHIINTIPESYSDNVDT